MQACYNNNIPPTFPCPNNIPPTSKHNEMTKQEQKNAPADGQTPSIGTLIDDDDDDEQPVEFNSNVEQQAHVSPLPRRYPERHQQPTAWYCIT